MRAPPSVAARSSTRTNVSPPSFSAISSSPTGSASQPSSGHCRGGLPEQLGEQRLVRRPPDEADLGEAAHELVHRADAAPDDGGDAPGRDRVIGVEQRGERHLQPHLGPRVGDVGTGRGHRARAAGPRCGRPGPTPARGRAGRTSPTRRAFRTSRPGSLMRSATTTVGRRRPCAPVRCASSASSTGVGWAAVATSRLTGTPSTRSDRSCTAASTPTAPSASATSPSSSSISAVCAVTNTEHTVLHQARERKSPIRDVTNTEPGVLRADTVAWRRYPHRRTRSRCRQWGGATVAVPPWVGGMGSTQPPACSAKSSASSGPSVSSS